jgi:exportin-1
VVQRAPSAPAATNPPDPPTLDCPRTSRQLQQRTTAEKALKAYQDHPEAWSRVDSILEKAQTQQTKFFALQILESVIKFRWGALPVEQREGIKNYVSNLIIKYATNEQLFR